MLPGPTPLFVTERRECLEVRLAALSLNRESESYVSLCMFLVCTETGGSEVNPEHEPHIMKGGITAEMQVCGSGGVCEGVKSDVWR